MGDNNTIADCFFAHTHSWNVGCLQARIFARVEGLREKYM